MFNYIHPTTRKVQREYHKLAGIYNEHWHDYLQATHKQAIEMLKPADNDRILDASAGTGFLGQMIRQKADSELALIDISDEMLEVARHKIGDDKATIIKKMDVHYLDFPDNYFSKLTCLNSFHFYAEPHKVLREFHRVLDQSGKLVMVDWCRDSWHFKLYDAIMRITGMPYTRSYTSSEFLNMLKNAGFAVTGSHRWSHRFWSMINITAEKY
ncbi:MAG: class I SAM-dependent methyltransferase [Balneolales bacterium]